MSALDRHDAARLDAWITREPDYPEESEPLHCSNCGGFLKAEPDTSETKEETASCSGLDVVFIDTYTTADAGLLDIIGWEHLSKRYEVSYDPPCGQSGDHEPHSYVAWAWVEYVRTCGRCGAKNAEVDA